MTARQFFIHQTWWGKALGAFFGFLIGGPAGALLGLLMGNFFDRGLHEHFTKPFWLYQVEKKQHLRTLFFKELYTLLGYLAKANGRVSESFITVTQTFMREMSLNDSEKKQAQVYFHQGKSPTFNLNQTLGALKDLRQNPALAQLFVQTLYKALQQTGPSNHQLQYLNIILRTLRFAPLHQQRSAFEDLFNDFASQQQRTYTPRPPPQDFTLSEAYRQLGVEENTTMSDIKRAYRRLISKHHPDRLIAKGLPESQIKAANETTQKIRKAYELICKQRGI